MRALIAIIADALLGLFLLSALVFLIYLAGYNKGFNEGYDKGATYYMGIITHKIAPPPCKS